jgi:hypothetical protein
MKMHVNVQQPHFMLNDSVLLHLKMEDHIRVNYIAKLMRRK